MPKRFCVALSFPGEYRGRVESIATKLATHLGRDRILYDRWHASELNRTNLDVYLPKLYHEDSELVAVFLCKEYHAKDWCGLEWRALRDRLKRREDEHLMFFRLDDADIPGLYSIDGYQDIRHITDEDVAESILERLNSRDTRPPTLSASDAEGSSRRRIPKLVATTSLVGIMLLATMLLFFVRARFLSPVISEVRPPRLARGGVCTIIGENLGADPNAITITVGGHRVQHLSHLEGDAVEFIVPDEASQGTQQLQLTKRANTFRILPDLFATKEIVVEERHRRVAILDEIPRTRSGGLEVGFSVLNRTSSEVTITSIDLYTLAAANTSVNYVTPRIDLGMFTITLGRSAGTRHLTAATQLLPDDVVLKLSPTQADSLHFLITDSKSSYGVRLIVLFGCHFFDSEGNTGIAFGGNVLSIVASDIGGYRSEGSKPLDDRTLAELKAAYGEELRIPDEYYEYAKNHNP